MASGPPNEGFTRAIHSEAELEHAALLAALAGVLAAPIYSVNPNMGADVIIVVFAVVVIGGMGSILGSIVTGLGLGVIEGRGRQGTFVTDRVRRPGPGRPAVHRPAAAHRAALALAGRRRPPPAAEPRSRRPFCSTITDKDKCTRGRTSFPSRERSGGSGLSRMLPLRNSG